jgi:hypothetical protein
MYNKCFFKVFSVANLTIVSHNASVVKIYNTASSLVSFEIKIFYNEKCSSLPPTVLALCVVVNYVKSRWIGSSVFLLKSDTARI